MNHNDELSEIYNELQDWYGKSVKYLHGVGPKRAEALLKLGITTFRDLLYHIPFRYEDRTKITPISEIDKEKVYQIEGKLADFREHRPRGSGVKHVLTANLYENDSFITIVWFNQKFLRNSLEQAEKVILYGQVEKTIRGLEILSPDYFIPDKNRTNPGIIPVYPKTEGIDPKAIRQFIQNVINSRPNDFIDWLPPKIRKKHKLLNLHETLSGLHSPEIKKFNNNWEKFEIWLEKGRFRLVFEELFLFSLKMSIQRLTIIQPKGISHGGKRIFKSSNPYDITLINKCLSILPYELTLAQKRELKTLIKDLAAPHPMYRLLQGDVGSGKTIVMLLAMLQVVEFGHQCALMAPTELLAEQHYSTFSTIVKDFNLKIGFLSGSMSSSAQNKIMKNIDSFDILIGTHSLFQEKIKFTRLGFVVVDEQHKFGVMQRAKLISKGDQPDVLVVSATPIPRTLALTLYGDMAVSVIDELPPGRKSVKTRWTTADKREKVFGFLRDKIEKGSQVYIVYPLKEESEKMPDLFDATERQEYLAQEIFNHLKVGLIHGGMARDEKDDVMRKFKSGTIQILVATTVVEVGMDVPTASIMVIEHAERFGLAQLHQLRGRVGRGSEQSYCILITGKKLTSHAKERMKAMESTNDGFRIAEVDMEIRGPGELMGTMQSGLLGFKNARLPKDTPILAKAYEDSREILINDPNLEHPSNKCLKMELESTNISDLIIG